MRSFEAPGRGRVTRRRRSLVDGHKKFDDLIPSEAKDARPARPGLVKKKGLVAAESLRITWVTATF